MNAIVTGGTQGIGFAVAEAMAAAGGKVLVTGRDEARLARAVRALVKATAPGGDVVGAVADVRDREAVEAAMERAAAAFGSIDTLVNNAGVGRFRSVEEMTDEEWSDVIDTNLTGAFYATRAAIPHLKRNGGGWIINIASLAGRNYFANGGAYCASKAGLVALSEAVMLEVRNDNIRVSCIMPGSVATGFTGQSGHGDQSWKLTGDDIAVVVMDLLRHRKGSLPSKVEIRPARTS